MAEKQVIQHELGICEFWLLAFAFVGFVACASRCASRTDINIDQVKPEPAEVHHG